MEKITRSEALERGLNQFFEGRLCVRGHRAPRWVHNYGCTACHKRHSENRRKSAKGKAYQAGYYERVKSEHLERIMFQSAKKRAKKGKLPFEITPDDIRKLFPADGICPALGIPLDFGGNNNEFSPTLDRLRAEQGYVRGNLAVISMRANRMKNDCVDPTVFRRIADWLEKTL